jgi:hypothetical protein
LKQQAKELWIVQHISQSGARTKSLVSSLLSYYWKRDCMSSSQEGGDLDSYGHLGSMDDIMLDVAIVSQWKIFNDIM